MRKDDITNQVILDFTDVVIKGVLKAKIVNIGWVRIDDFHIKSGENLPSPNNIEDWITFIKKHIDLAFPIEESYGLILEIYENYEGYLLFSSDLIVGDVVDEEYEDVYGGNHFD